jgi:hypothetical protein
LSPPPVPQLTSFSYRSTILCGDLSWRQTCGAWVPRSVEVSFPKQACAATHLPMRGKGQESRGRAGWDKALRHVPLPFILHTGGAHGGTPSTRKCRSSLDVHTYSSRRTPAQTTPCPGMRGAHHFQPPFHARTYFEYWYCAPLDAGACYALGAFELSSRMQTEMAAVVVSSGPTATEPSSTAPPRPGAAAAEVLDGHAHGRADLPLSALPAMPPPRLMSMRTEAAGGCTTVLAIIGVCVGGTHWSVLVLGKMDNALPPLFLSAIWAEALVAVLCLAGLMFGDPGVVERSELRCLPMPDDIADLLRAGQAIPADMRNIEDPVQGTYCVRCMVWRKHHEKAHHCSTCQRCVTDFDHHCGVFGRCIAGRGFRGNMGYFKLIIFMALLGIVTFAAALLLGLTRGALQL